MITPLEIRRSREALKLTQAEFAKFIGASDGRVVRRWEAGRFPAFKFHAALERATKLTEEKAKKGYLCS